jgi:hypothetical protein
MPVPWEPDPTPLRELFTTLPERHTIAHTSIRRHACTRFTMTCAASSVAREGLSSYRIRPGEGCNAAELLESIASAARRFVAI